MHKKRLIVDASNALHRMYHGMPYLSSVAGIPTHALTGFIKHLWKIEDEFDGDMHIAFDSPCGSEWRRNLLSDIAPYKGGRVNKDSDLSIQLEIAYDMMCDMGYCCYRHDEYEADDIMHTLACENSFLFTHDKDMFQTVRDGVMVVRSKSGNWVLYTEFEVIGKMGVPPSHIADFIALSGDSSDNIPGISGVGPKTAAKLILEHGDCVTAAASKFASRVHDVEVMKRAATLRTIPDIKGNFHPDYDSACSVMRNLDMRSTMAQFQKRKSITPVFKLPD